MNQDGRKEELKVQAICLAVVILLILAGFGAAELVIWFVK